jgi:hypothetical protein
VSGAVEIGRLHDELTDAKASIARMQPLVLCAQQLAPMLLEAAHAPLLDAEAIDRIGNLARRLDLVAEGFATACEEAATDEEVSAVCGQFRPPPHRVVMTSEGVQVTLPASASGLPITISVDDPVGVAADNPTRVQARPDLFTVIEGVLAAYWDTHENWSRGYLCQQLVAVLLDAPSFNHTRGDSSINPCPLCAAQLRLQDRR